ncbi:MAG: hypothetical protein WD649_06030 [Thermoleophilaceae bacterium]
MSARAALAALALGAALGVAGCGDDEETDGRATEGAGAESATTTTRSGTTADTTAGTEESTGAAHDDAGSREDEVPGGPGDEIPASGPADFTGRAGRIGPLLVRVPPFLGIGVTLRSVDGRDYGLRIGGKTLRVGLSKRTASARLEGLRPGRSYKGSVLDRGGTVRIEASAEPGP